MMSTQNVAGAWLALVALAAAGCGAGGVADVAESSPGRAAATTPAAGETAPAGAAPAWTDVTLDQLRRNSEGFQRLGDGAVRARHTAWWEAVRAPEGTEVTLEGLVERDGLGTRHCGETVDTAVLGCGSIFLQLQGAGVSALPEAPFWGVISGTRRGTSLHNPRLVRYVEPITHPDPG